MSLSPRFPKTKSDVKPCSVNFKSTYIAYFFLIFKTFLPSFFYFTGVGRKRSQISLGDSSEYSLKIMDADMVNLTGTIKTPSGNIEPCFLKKLVDGSLGK